jgi:hypothetical protein
MTAVHAHVFLNQIPVVGLMFGLVFLIAGMKPVLGSNAAYGLTHFRHVGLIETPRNTPGSPLRM